MIQVSEAYFLLLLPPYSLLLPLHLPPIMFCYFWVLELQAGGYFGLCLVQSCRLRVEQKNTPGHGLHPMAGSKLPDKLGWLSCAGTTSGVNR